MYHCHCQHQIHQLMLNHAICWVWGRWGVKYHLRERLHDQKNGLTQDAVFYETWNTFLVLESFSPPFFSQHVAPFSHSTPTSKAGFSYFSLIFPHTPTNCPYAAPKSTTVNVFEEFDSAESLKAAKNKWVWSKRPGKKKKKKKRLCE